MPTFDYFKQAQSYYAQSPAIILGSGASAAFGMSGMGALADYLKSSVDNSTLGSEECIEWDKFVTLLDQNVDLESALHQVNLSERLTGEVVRNTWSLITPEDLNVFDNSLHVRDFFPLGRLLADYFKSTATSIDIITTNYDRLGEYSCEQEGFHHYTGFSHGFRRLLKEPEYLRCERVVNIWKVHGSLDWFKSNTSEVVGFGNVTEIPNDFTPQIVTPGTEKYRITHLEPFRTIIAKADHAIESANSYLAIGFGFNDQHIQEKLIQKCLRDKASITVITYQLSDATKTFLFESGIENYIAIERGSHDNESIIYSSMVDTPITVDEDHWTLQGYLNLIL